MKSIQSNHIVYGVVAFFLFIIGAIYITYPLPFHLGDYITDYGDELVYSWMYGWVIHIVSSGNFLQLNDTNIFHPFYIGIANSDPNIVTSLLAIIPFLIIKEPIVSVNFTVISSIVFVGFSIYLLAYYLTRNFFVSIFAGMILIFSPAFLSFYAHIQMLAVEFVPLAVLFFIHFLKKRTIRFFALSLLCFILQMYNNFIAGYFIIFVYVIFFGFFWINNKKQAMMLFSKKILGLFLLTILIVIPVMLPYFAVSKEYHYVRDIRDTIHFALEPEDYLYSSNFSRIHSVLNTLPFNRVSQNDEFKPGFPGITFSLLIIITVIIGLRKRKKLAYIGSFLTLAVTGFVLSLGPFLHLGRVTVHHPFPIPLPYALFYYILPGFQGFRNSARWEMLFLISMAIVCAMVLNFMFKKYAMRWQIVLYTVLTISCIAEFSFPMSFKQVPTTNNFPQYEYWLTTTPKDTTIIEMPVYNWNMTPYSTIEFWRLYYSTIHYRNTFNGAGGFTPPPWQEMAFSLDASFPSEKSVSTIKEMKINYIIVHANEFDTLHRDKYKIKNTILPSGKETISALSKNKSLHFVKQFGDDYVFQFINRP